MYMKFLPGPFNFQNLNLLSISRIVMELNVGVGKRSLRGMGREGDWECVCSSAIPGEQGRASGEGILIRPQV